MKHVLLLIIVFICLASVGYAQCISGNCQNGYGEAIVEGAVRYEGMWKNGVQKGYGRVYKPSGTLIYEGDWNGMSDAVVYQYVDGYIAYKGCLKNDKISGVGLLFEAKGVLLYKGGLKNGKPDGYGHFYKNGVFLREGYWTKGDEYSIDWSKLETSVAIELEKARSAMQNIEKGFDEQILTGLKIMEMDKQIIETKLNGQRMIEKLKRDNGVKD